LGASNQVKSAKIECKTGIIGWLSRSRITSLLGNLDMESIGRPEQVRRDFGEIQTGFPIGNGV